MGAEAGRARGAASGALGGYAGLRLPAAARAESRPACLRAAPGAREASGALQARAHLGGLCARRRVLRLWGQPEGFASAVALQGQGVLACIHARL